MQIIIWNNNLDRAELVSSICAPYLKRKRANKSLELIQSSENHYAAIRLALPPLMKSDTLLICDDDVIPGENFVSFFMDVHRKKHPKDILCVRGHYFLQHDLKMQCPEDEWTSYENVKFADD